MKNIFIAGKAGAGKTFAAKYIDTLLKARGAV